MAKTKNKSIIDSELYSVTQAATLLGITAQTVSKYLRSGELKGEKKGPKGKWHVSGAAIRKMLKDWNMLN